MADRYQNRIKERNALVRGIKEDIKVMLTELGFGDSCGYAQFSYTCKPDRFQSVGIDFGHLYFKDNDGCDWNSDNVNDIQELLHILRAMHHILPK